MLVYVIQRGRGENGGHENNKQTLQSDENKHCNVKQAFAC